MPGQQHVHGNLRERFHGRLGAQHDAIADNAGRQIERVMRDHDFDVSRYGCESRPQLLQLTPIDPAVLAGKRARSIDPRHGDLIINIEWLEVIRDPAPEPVELAEQPGKNVAQRHIMIAGHDNFRKRDRIQKVARFQKLPGARALGQVAGYCDEIGFRDRDEIEQRPDDRGCARPKCRSER